MEERGNSLNDLRLFTIRCKTWAINWCVVPSLPKKDDILFTADDEDLKLCVALTQIIIPWNQGIHPKSATVSPPAQIPTPPCVTLTLLTEMTSPCLKMPSEIGLAPPYKLFSLLILLKTAAYLPIYIAIWFNHNVVICRDTTWTGNWSSSLEIWPMKKKYDKLATNLSFFRSNGFGSLQSMCRIHRKYHVFNTGSSGSINWHWRLINDGLLGVENFWQTEISKHEILGKSTRMSS